jgi:predicted ATPase
MLVSHTTDRPDRLPAETTEFVGRVAELCRIEALLRENRLVTLVGPGGVGKTRLALRAAARAAADYPDGSCLVELSALRDPELLPHTVAGRLGLPEQSPGSQLDMVLARLSDRHSLLILDTCEHLIDACALFVEAIISGAPSVTVLVTSREPLAAGGESCYTVPPLGLPGERPRRYPDSRSPTRTGPM